MFAWDSIIPYEKTYILNKIFLPEKMEEEYNFKKVYNLGFVSFFPDISSEMVFINLIRSSFYPHEVKTNVSN